MQRRLLPWAVWAMVLGAGALAALVAATVPASVVVKLSAGLAAAAVASSAAAFVLWRRLIRPQQVLCDQSMKLAQGEKGIQIEPLPGDLGPAAQVFNYMSQQLGAYETENKKLYKSVEEGYLQTMLALASVIDSKDSYTLGHSQRVGAFAAELGKELGMPEVEVRNLLYAGILHDVGKIGIVEPILSKRGELTSEEMDAMRAHATIGASIVSGIRFLRPMLPAVRHHHERWDGSGYPDGLAGEKIPMIARIVGAADIWDACTSRRPYQEPLTAEQALGIMRRMRGKQLDPTLVDAIERIVRRKQEAGELVSSADPQWAPKASAG